MINGAPDLLELCSAVGGRSYDALPPVRIRQFGSILPWAWPHVPCHTLGAIRDNYEFGLVLSYHGASLATGVQVVLYANCTTMLKNCVKGDQCKALTLGKIFYLTIDPTIQRIVLSIRYFNGSLRDDKINK